jgi:release factor glutamine methyltransferase|tara:strand:- start:18792 stop:19649 length:858 start_codon:yes stop_codon:yes gene_type:complete
MFVMTLREGQEHFKDGLGGFFQSSEIDFYYKTLLKDGLNRDPIQLSIEPWVELTSEEEFFVKESLSKLIVHQPLQYVLGKAHFRDLTLKVDKRVLIPRPETEEMVEWVLEDFKKLNQKLILIDMGTGSGCIGIALAKAQPYFSVFALDKDVDILDLTAENAKLNGVQIKCIEQDMNQMNTLKLKIDVIVSNPPYVMLSEQNQMKSNVLDYEPHQAIFISNKDPLLFYRLILEFAADNLKPKGFIYFEINPLLLKELKDLIISFSYIVFERLDIFKKVRMLRLQKK